MNSAISEANIPNIPIDANRPPPGGFGAQSAERVENYLLKRKLNKRTTELLELCQIILDDRDLMQLHEKADELIWTMVGEPL